MNIPESNSAQTLALFGPVSASALISGKNAPRGLDATYDSQGGAAIEWVHSILLWAIACYIPFSCVTILELDSSKRRQNRLILA